MKPDNEKGQAAAELALVLPVLLLILFGCIDLGRVFASWMTLTNAAREGARFGSMHPLDVPGIRNAALAEATAGGLTGVSVAVSTAGSGTGDPSITVDTAGTVKLVTPIPGTRVVTMQASATMVVMNEGGS